MTQLSEIVADITIQCFLPSGVIPLGSIVLILLARKSYKMLLKQKSPCKTLTRVCHQADVFGYHAQFALAKHVVQQTAIDLLK